MNNICGVAYSILHDSLHAGKEMARDAMLNASIATCDIAFVFASGEHDPEEILNGVKSILGNQTRIIGGVSSGVITNDYIGYEGYHAGILVVASPDIMFHSCDSDGLDEGEYPTGVRLGKELNSLLKVENPNLLLFYDMVRSVPEKNNIYYKSSPILAGIESQIKQWPTTAGVGLATFSGIKKTELWNEYKRMKDNAMALVVSGNVKLDTIIMHGCKPASDYHTITKLDDNIVYELDHQPPMNLIQEYFGANREIDWKTAAYFLTLGVNRGEKYIPFEEGNYVNRMVMNVDQYTGALQLLEDDLNEGDEFQFMRRSIETDVVAQRTQELLNQIGDREPLFAFYISCLGRIKKNFGTEKEEASEVQKVIGDRFPLLGIYSGTEIAEVKGKIMPLDWTGVLCIFSRSKPE